MSKNFLFIVEGEITEKDILANVLSRYGFEACDVGTIDISKDFKDLIVTELNEPGKENVFIVQGPRNRIHDWLVLFNTEQEDFERYFSGLQNNFAGIFIIYDVDHTSNDDLVRMFEKYSDETSTGLLLLNSPCIETLADINRTECLAVLHLTDYKKELNINFDKSHHCSAKQYIIDHFEELILYYLDKNSRELGSNNIMDHPTLILNQINKLNERKFIDKNNQPVIYRYFTTVLYVCIAYIKGLTKEINNVTLVKDFFQSMLASSV